MYIMSYCHYGLLFNIYINPVLEIISNTPNNLTPIELKFAATLNGKIIAWLEKLLKTYPHQNLNYIHATL